MPVPRSSIQIAGIAQLPVEQGIVVGRESLRQIQIARRKILAEQKIVGEGMAIGDQVFKQAAHTQQASAARTARQGRSFPSQAAKPAQDVRIAPQLFGAEEAGVSGPYIAQETVEAGLIIANGAGLQAGGQGLYPELEKGLEIGRRVHGCWRGGGELRVAMAR